MILLTLNHNADEPFSWRTILLTTSLLGLISAYCIKASYTLLFSFFGLAVWWLGQAEHWLAELDRAGEVIQTSAVLGGLGFFLLLLYPLGRLHRKSARFKQLGLIYSGLGIAALTGGLFFFSTGEGVSLIEDMKKGERYLTPGS